MSLAAVIVSVCIKSSMVLFSALYLSLAKFMAYFGPVILGDSAIFFGAGELQATANTAKAKNDILFM